MINMVGLGPLDAIPLGQGRTAVVGDRTIAVFRQRDGRLFASSHHCPHRGGPLADGLVGDGKVVCPMHGWKIDLERGCCLGETAAVEVYPVETVDGQVRVHLPE